MRIIVTGSLGFIGHHVVAALIKGGHQVIGVDKIDNAISLKGERIEAQKNWRVTTEDVNLSDITRVLDLVGRHRPHAIIHLAGQYSVKYTTESCVRYVQNNLVATTYVFEAAKVHRVPRVVYASSVASEDNRRPSGLYGATKGYAEQCAHAYTARSQMSAVGLRYGPTYGPMIRRDAPAFVALREYLDGLPISDCALFTRAMPYAEVRDAARVTADLATCDRLPERHNVFLVASNDQLASLVDFVNVAKESVRREPRWPKRCAPHERSKIMPKLDDLEAALGYLPSTKLHDGVGSMLRWMNA